MSEQNMTRISTIRVLGFQTNQSIRGLIFFLLLLIHCGILCGNFLIITTVFSSKALQSPMYFFLSQLAVIDILMATDILPNTLHICLVGETMISFSGCITQLYLFAVAGAAGYFLITVMSYDRYLAICKPLHYTSVMSQNVCWMMVVVCWTLSILVALICTIPMLMLCFCGPNVIDHFFCCFDPILQLSCSDTTVIQLEITAFCAFFLVFPFLVIIMSYIYIILTVFRIPSVTGKQKAFSTCTSHLSVVCTYFGTVACVYLVPSIGQSKSMTKFLSLLYTAGTPLMNPIIYSLRNKDLKHIVNNKLMNFHFNR